MSAKTRVLVLSVLLECSMSLGANKTKQKIIVLLFFSLSLSINGKLNSKPLSLCSWEFNYYDSNAEGINEKRKDVKDGAKEMERQLEK